MRSDMMFSKPGTPGFSLPRIPRQLIIGAIFIVALCAFEIFNFDTTEFALESLLGQASFMGIQWATILAIAFCAIDFAGLARIFTPENGRDEPKEVWYLTGAWLLGATMNAVMTWWAVSLLLLSHDFGNEVLSRDQLLKFVPVFIAALVWLTRILFIGSMAVAGDQLFDFGRSAKQPVTQPQQNQAKAPQQTRPALQQPTAQAYSSPTAKPSQQRSPSPTPVRRPAPLRTQGSNSRSRHLNY